MKTLTVLLLAAAVLACLSLSGCVSESAILKNPQGQSYRCYARGYGVVSSMMAKAAFEDCMAEAAAKGYQQ